MISLAEVVLLLRGWADNRSHVRVVFESGEVTLGISGTVWKVKEAAVSFLVGYEGGGNVVGFSLADWKFDFTDVPPEEAKLKVGGLVESGIVGVKDGTHFTVMLLGDLRPD